MNVDCNILGNGSTISVLACAPRANRMHRRWYKQLQWTRIHLRSFVPTQLKFKDIVKYWWSGNILKQTNNRSSVHRWNYLFRLNESKAREKKPTTCCFGSRKQAMFSASSRFGSIRCPAGLRKGAGPIHGFRREKRLEIAVICRSNSIANRFWLNCVDVSAFLSYSRFFWQGAQNMTRSATHWFCSPRQASRTLDFTNREMARYKIHFPISERIVDSVLRCLTNRIKTLRWKVMFLVQFPVFKPNPLRSYSLPVRSKDVRSWYKL